jgi:cell shape-determining protein MreD
LLVFFFYRTTRIQIAFLALFAGFLVDLTAFDQPFINVITFTITTYFLYPQKQNFFIDSISTYPILTFFFSFATTLLNRLVLGYPISLPFLFSDMLYYPLVESFIAFTIFTLPQIVFGPPVRRGKEYFL